MEVNCYGLLRDVLVKLNYKSHNFICFRSLHIENMYIYLFIYIYKHGKNFKRFLKVHSNDLAPLFT